MFNRLDLTGQKFGKWFVLCPAGTNKRRQSMSFCRCDCGQYKTVPNIDLKRGNSTSCGCYFRERSSKQFRDPFTPRTKSINIKQTFRNMLYRQPTSTITLEQLTKLLSSGYVCHWCKTRLATEVDRIDSNDAYHIYNVLPACNVCNRMKGPLNAQQFQSTVLTIARAHPSPGWSEEYFDREEIAKCSIL